MSAPAKLPLLQHIVSHVRLEKPQQGPLGEDGIRALGMFTAKLGPDGFAGIRFEAAEAVVQLADAIFSGNPSYRRGATFSAVQKQLTDEVITTYAGTTNVTVAATDLAAIEKKIENWFNTQAATHEFYIPCFVTPWQGPPFAIGSVHFAHVSDFVPKAQAETGVMFDFTFRPMFEHMGRMAANWVATVAVDGCTKERAQEIADLAVDLALAGLQTVLAHEDAERMGRMTGRTMPVFSQAVSRSSGAISCAVANSEPGRLFGPDLLNKCISERKPILESIGRRIEAFVRGSVKLADLEQAWADAAYWFHEGLAEPLDTIAVPKLETSIEILLRSESTKGSKARLVKAIKVFYGKKPSDLINSKAQITVDEFAQGLVRDRSRILHGTWSTLTHSLRASRPSLTSLTRVLLAEYSGALDQYVADASATDDIDALLDFVDAQRQAAVGPANATAPQAPVAPAPAATSQSTIGSAPGGPKATA